MIVKFSCGVPVTVTASLKVAVNSGVSPATYSSALPVVEVMAISVNVGAVAVPTSKTPERAK